MILCFDVGNTDIDTGVFENDILVKTFNIPYSKSQPAQEYEKGIRDALSENNIDKETVEDCVLCSVVAIVTDAISRAISDIFGKEAVMFNKDNCDMVIKTDNPREVGTDIIVGCLAVKERYTMPAIVLDMGTATTVTAMDKDGAILGVSIVTGAIPMLRALNTSTGLPVDYELLPPPKAIGTNTPDSIASGAVFGYAYMMDGLIKAFEKEMGAKCNIYATGGIAKVIMPLAECECTINNSLLLDGLYMYYKSLRKK
ncbi:MAG: type III pantothenate kinase [Oscillospiraceae bacterium]|nr:type III pantothenate kinase [Oscillospiraceae bacterium]